MLILNYGVGNIFSISNAFRRLGAEVVVERQVGSRVFDAVVLPGVGSFSAAAENIAPYREALKEWIESGVPTLGICLGLQLFFESSDEGPGMGLGLFGGRVTSLPDNVKRPHMGWNKLHRVKPASILEDVDDAWVYFNHTFYPKPSDQGVIAATTEYGVEFPCVIAGRNIYGTQFHPEKSSVVGEKILKNFVRECRR